MTTNELEENRLMQKENCKGAAVRPPWPPFYMFFIIGPYRFNYRGLWDLAESLQSMYSLAEVVFMTSLQAENLDETVSVLDYR